MAVKDIFKDVEKPEGTCTDKNCPYHGNIKVRGRVRIGKVVSTKMTGTCTVQIDYLKYVPKYKRYMRARSKIHAHIPACINIREGDIVKIGECRRLAKTVSHVVLGRVIKYG